MAPSNPPLFSIPSDPSPSSTPSSPPASNLPSNGLFSAASTPRGPQRAPSGSTLFAGATPGLKPTAGKFGGLSRAGPSSLSAPLLPFAAPGGAGGTAGTNKIPQFSKPVSESAFAAASPANFARKGGAGWGGNRFPSANDDDDDGEAGSPRIFEDESRCEEPTQQDDEDMDGEYEEETGMFFNGDDDDEADDSYHVLPESSAGKGRRAQYGTECRIKPGMVREPGSMIIQTEEIMMELQNLLSPTAPLDYDSELDEEDMIMDADRNAPLPPSKREEYLTRAARLFLDTLASNLPKGQARSRLHKAYYLASLLLPLHHSRANAVETLRRWLYTHKQAPTRKELTALKNFYPNAIYSFSYWEILQQLIMRGEVQEAMDLLRCTDWDMLNESNSSVPKPKIGDTEEPTWDRRYSNEEIESIKNATASAIKLLSTCPGLARSSYAPSSVGFFPATGTSHGSKGDWRIWQGKVFAAAEDVRAGGEGDGETTFDETDDSYYESFHPRNGGSYGFEIGTGKTKEKKTPVPGEVSRGLRAIYDVMRGDREAILSHTEKWEDAVLATMMWGVTDGFGDPDSSIGDDSEEEDEEEEDGIYDDGAGKALNRRRREKDLVRLSKVTESLVGSEMPLDATNELELAVGACLVWDTNVVVQVMPKFSLLVASALIEMCGHAGSIQRGKIGIEENARGMMDGFDEDELAVFGMGRGFDAEVEKADGVVKEYGTGLFGVDWVDEKAQVEGWEVAVGVLHRVGGGREMSGKLLTQLELTSKERVEKLLTYCGENNLEDEASEIAAVSVSSNIATPERSNGRKQSFAERLSGTTSYGDSLHFFALANDRFSLHNILTKLTTSSLLHSTPSPAPPSLDPVLSDLLKTPTSITSPILRFELSGYATLRNFYESRDSGDHSRAVKALVAVLKSAGEKLDGGVYDADWDSAVEEWMIAVLLGELMPYINPRKRYLGMRQAMEVLKVITNFECVRGDVWRRAEEFLERVLAHKDSGGSGNACEANGMTESGYIAGSMVSSWESVRDGIDSGLVSADATAGTARRAWDWREGAEGWKAADIIRVVRLGIAKIVADAWLLGE
ncbi:unnamed protein product [Tuber aestivum]|uniref:Nuclear pore complex protein Nup85 n=1 Tax=Tuber aestivum TaxID=59557 RepID=A0A292Q842_9PEZI|nr:unnamed protein product [Tuber aestivum]